MSIQQMLFAGGGIQVINVNLNVTQTTPYDLFVAIGSPANPVEVNLTVSADCQAGIVQGSGWASGSTCKIINNAGIYGEAGAGGVGGSAIFFNAVTKFFTDGISGGVGGDALSLSIPTTIDNTAGYIFGGGGGGGGGFAATGLYTVSQWATGNAPYYRASGGGGGGGRGYNNAAGGAAGNADPNTSVGGAGSVGVNGSAGSSSGAGAGGNGVIGGLFQCRSSDGGAGGDWGLDGSAGSSTSGISNTQQTNPGVGGPAGYAVRQNGNSLTWLGGNNASQVKGLVG